MNSGLGGHERGIAQLADLMLVTTVPETFATILRGQPGHLSKRFRITVVSSPDLSAVKGEEGVAACEVPMDRGISLKGDVVSLVRMIRALRTAKPSLIHSYTPKAGLVAMVSAWICRVPIRIHTFTGLIFPTSYGYKRMALAWADRLICACATHVVPEGEGVKNDLKRFKVTRKPLRIIGNGNIAGVDTSHYSPAAANLFEATDALRATLEMHADYFAFCFIGRLNRDKGLAELMVALNAIASDAYLLLVGAQDASAPVDSATAELIRSHPRVRQSGFLDDIRPALKLADVLVLPSYREGFPNVVLQAGAMEVPVIATDINGCNEIVEPGLNGWLVPPRDTAALAGAMRDAMRTDRVVREQMGRQARARIQQRFEQRDHWERMVQFYQGLLDARARN